MSFGIDDSPKIIIDCLNVVSFSQKGHLLANGLIIHTKPQEYAQRIPEEVCKFLEQLGASRVKLTTLEKINLGELKNDYRFIPHKYDC